MAPELFPSSDSSGNSSIAVDQAVDIYSFGILMWEVLSGEQPKRFSKSLRNIR